MTDATDDLTSAEHRPFTRRYRGYFLALMVTISALSVIDRVALPTVGQAIKLDLKLTDLQFGLISGFGFALLYAVLGLPLARIADTKSRVRMVSIAVAVWSVFALLSGLARNFVQLMVCRLLIGIGEAGVQPPTISVISDLYPPKKRGAALAILSVGIPIGALAGSSAAGYLAQLYSWRIVFLVLGAPGLILAIVAWLTLREPLRGLSERKTGETGPAPGVVAVFRHLAVKPSFWHVLMAVAVTNFASAGIGQFLPQYFARVYTLNLGLIGVLYGAVGATSTLVGTVSGGYLVDWASRRDERWYAWLPGIGVLLGAPMYILAFVLPNPVTATAALTVAGALMYLHYTPSQVILQNMVEPRMRATAAFIFYFVASMVGLGLGPALFGFASDQFAQHAFTAGSYGALCPGGAATAGAAPEMAHACRAASAEGIRWAMVCASCLFFWSMAHFFLAARTMRNDLAPSS